MREKYESYDWSRWITVPVVAICRIITLFFEFLLVITFGMLFIFIGVMYRFFHYIIMTDREKTEHKDCCYLGGEFNPYEYILQCKKWGDDGGL